MRALVARGGAAVGIGHADQIVGGGGLGIDRLDGAKHHVHFVLGRGFDHRGGGIKGRRHAPGARIGFGEADEIRAFRRRAFDVAHRIGDVLLIFAGPVGDWLDYGDAKGHGAAPAGMSFAASGAMED
jgi:hypothetical protein